MATIGCVTKLHQNTFIAGCQFDHGSSYRCFYQCPNGSVHAFLTNSFGSPWSGGDQTQMIPEGCAKLETPMSSVMFTNGQQQACSRTFYIGTNHEIRVFGVTGGQLSDGKLNQGEFVAAEYSRVSAVAWTDGGHVHMRIYFQTSDDCIQEICYDDDCGETFTVGHKFPAPLKGTALAFICMPTKSGHPIIRGFYQTPDCCILQMIYEDAVWREGVKINGDIPVENRSHIAACVSIAGQVHVYWTTHCGEFHAVTECVQVGDCWDWPKLISICCSPHTPRLLCCAYCPANSSETCVRFFFVGCNGLINDLKREHCKWQPCC